MIDVFIAGGVEIPIDAVVHTWEAHTLVFTTSLRSHETRAIVNHWTAAENPPDRVFANMKNHRNALTQKLEPLSVHFVVDAIGEVWQFADTDARCSHCKAHEANSWTVGIEFVCRGDNFAAPQRGHIRQRSSGVIHGDRVSYDDLTAAQIQTGIRLNEALCKVYSLPMRVPETSTGELYNTELPAKYIARFAGCLAHFELERKKRDPGLTLMLAIQERGRELEPRPVA